MSTPIALRPTASLTVAGFISSQGSRCVPSTEFLCASAMWGASGCYQRTTMTTTHRHADTLSMFPRNTFGCKCVQALPPRQLLRKDFELNVDIAPDRVGIGANSMSSVHDLFGLGLINACNLHFQGDR